MSERYFTVKTLAASSEYGLIFTERYTRRLIYEGRIPYIKIGSKVFLTAKDLDAFLNSNHIAVRPGNHFDRELRAI